MPDNGNSGFKKATSNVLTALAILLTAALFISGLFVRVRLTEQNDENVALLRQLDELKEENTRLTIRYETLFNAAELEEYAEDVLGMRRPDAVCPVIMDTQVRDKAVITDK